MITDFNPVLHENKLLLICNPRQALLKHPTHVSMLIIIFFFSLRRSNFSVPKSTKGVRETGEKFQQLWPGSKLVQYIVIAAYNPLSALSVTWFQMRGSEYKGEGGRDTNVHQFFTKNVSLVSAHIFIFLFVLCRSAVFVFVFVFVLCRKCRNSKLLKSLLIN